MFLKVRSRISWVCGHHQLVLQENHFKMSPDQCYSVGWRPEQRVRLEPGGWFWSRLCPMRATHLHKGLLICSETSYICGEGRSYLVFYFCCYENQMKCWTCFVKLKGTIPVWPSGYSLFPRGLATWEFTILHLKIWGNARAMGFKQNALTAEYSFVYILRDMTLKCMNRSTSGSPCRAGCHWDSVIAWMCVWCAHILALSFRATRTRGTGWCTGPPARAPSTPPSTAATVTLRPHLALPSIFIDLVRVPVLEIGFVLLCDFLFSHHW